MASPSQTTSGVPALAGAPVESPTGKVYPPNTSASLTGNMEPVTTEVEGCLVAVHGALPSDLDGQFIRNGPNPVIAPFGKEYHEFYGDGMLHASDLKGGVGNYRNRWIRTNRLEKQKEVGMFLGPREVTGSSVGSANTALTYHASQLLALFESDKPYVISAPELESLGQLTYDGQLKHSMTAHPKVCPKTGELIFFGYELMEPIVHYSVVDSNGELMHSMDVPTQCGKPVMMHDMAITEQYSILMEFPLYFDMQRAMEGKMPYVHDALLPSKFGIFPRHASSPSDIRWFEADSSMSFHIANAWEEGSQIKLVGCPQKKFSFEYEKSAPSQLYEWTFDLSTGKTAERHLDYTKVEFPVIHPHTVGRQCRYVWAAVFVKEQTATPIHGVCGCIKYDLSTGTNLRHDFIGGRWGGESVFAPRYPGGEGDEDDGYMLAYTFNPENNKTELYVFDAKTMDPNPVAILETPQRVPFGFHGIWLPRASV